jgi:nucleotide-binding universal stress UspA family protein
MFTKILVAVSANSSDTVLTSAIDLARKHNAQIVALHVVDPTPAFLGPADYSFGMIAEAMEEHGREVVTRMTTVLDDHAHPADTRMVTLPISGSTVGRAIAACAEETGADLIILGERKAAWWRFLNEDVAAEIRRRTDTPLQTLSEKAAGGAARRPGTRLTDVQVASIR